MRDSTGCLFFIIRGDFLKKDMKTLLPVILEAIENKNGIVRIYPHGKSMLPMIREGIDSVVLEKAQAINLYDIVLFERSGSYSLHRVIKVNGDDLIVCGDNQSVGEKIKKQDVLAKVESWYRDDEHIENDNEEYLKYIKKIMIIRPFRRMKRKFCKNSHETDSNAVQTT